MPQSKNNSNKKTTGKTTAQKTKKQTAKNTSKSSAPKETVKKPSESAFFYQAAPYILAVAAVLIAVCVIAGEGKIGGGIRGILTGLFAGGAYVLPVILLVRTFLWNRDVEEGQNRGRNIAAGVVFVLIAMLLHALGGGEATLSPKIHYTDGHELVGGGVIGGFFGELLMMGFGKVCSLIIVFTAIVLLSLYIAGITPRGVFIYIAYKIKYAGEKREENREKRLEKKRNAPIPKNKIREEEYLAYLREKKKKAAQDKSVEENVQLTAKAETLGKQIPLGTPQSTVYRVKRRRVVPVDIPVDDEAVSVENVNEAEEDNSAEVQQFLSDGKVDRNAVDEKLFDEVMRRTRERIEKSKRAEDIAERENASAPVLKKNPAEDFISAEDLNMISAGEVLDAVEIAAMGVRAKQGVNIVSDFDDEYDENDENEVQDDLDAADVSNEDAVTAESDEDYGNIPDETDTMKLISQVGKAKMTSSSDESSDEFDVTKIFVNPEDAMLLDKLSETYRKDSLDVKRETVSVPKTEELKKTTRPMPEYKFPPVDILAEDNNPVGENIKEELQENAVRLVETLKSFNVKTKIENISRGPTITRYELLPEPGTRVRSIVNLVDDIALNLATTGVRIEAPIPGKSAVGIEVPNKKQSTVHLRTLIEDSRFEDAKSKLTVCLGEDVAGEAVYFDIGKMPHLLIAGCTGSGKSVCINSIITSLLYKASPDDVKMILIDPKKVELNIYNGIPHLLVPVVSEPKKAAGSLSWAVSEMERRFGLIESVGVRDIKAYNEATKNDPDYEYMPRIVIVIDELADLMMTAPDDVEDSICRIAQKARAAGMHLVIGTQRPSVDVITGLIKANVPSRIAFRTSSQIDSRTIIDVGSAANLIGMGDMLFNPVGALKPTRVQGAYVSESDVEEVVAYIKNMNSTYDNSASDKIVNEIEREAQRCGVGGKKGSAAAADDGDEDEDPMLKSAIELAVDSGKISTSLIQRRLSLGYGRAAKLIDRMEQLGYVSAPDGQKPREVLITKQDYMEMRLKDEAPFDL